MTTLADTERTHSLMQGEDTELESMRSKLATTQAKLNAKEEVIFVTYKVSKRKNYNYKLVK